jgi:hypothetical protein
LLRHHARSWPAAGQLAEKLMALARLSNAAPWIIHNWKKITNRRSCWLRTRGGYMFIHRTMMEHIAGLDLEKWKEQPDSP